MLIARGRERKVGNSASVFLRGLHEDEPTLSCGADHYDMHTSTRLIADDTFYLAPVCLKYGASITSHPGEREKDGTTHSIERHLDLNLAFG